MNEPSLTQLVRELSKSLRASGSTADEPAEVEVVQTHISVVFLTPHRAYKLKKPKDLGFLDFTTLERRRRVCHEEVRLNRRMAPHVYEGVVAVVDDGDGPRFTERVWPDEPGGEEVLEWAVRMVRLPDNRTLRRLLRAGRAGEAELTRLADRIATFHASAEGGGQVAEGGAWETVHGNDRENFEQLEPFVGDTVGPTVLDRLDRLAADELACLRPLIERRAGEGVPRDTHGDLRLGHIYLLPAGSPGTAPRDSIDSAREGAAGDDEIVVIDCIEFNERFRWADPVSDLAFPVMELEFEDRHDLVGPFVDRYFAASEDAEGRELLPYYVTYRDIVRGKVRAFESTDEDVPDEARARAASKATRHFLRALDRLAAPSERPALVVVYGLPGVGKSTLAGALAERDGFHWIDTDRVRKELFGADGKGEADADGFEAGLYTPEHTRRTYEACLGRARERLFDGGRVVVEGSFRTDRHRSRFLDMAGDLGVRSVFLECVLSPAEARRRLADRTGDPSDADWEVHRAMAERWEPHSAQVGERRHTLSLDGGAPEGLVRALKVLSEAGISG